MPPGRDSVDRSAVTKNKVEIPAQNHSEELAEKRMALSKYTQLRKVQCEGDD